MQIKKLVILLIAVIFISLIGLIKTTQPSNCWANHTTEQQAIQNCETMSQFPKPCLTCNQLTTGGSYCATHQMTVNEREKQRQAVRKAGRTLYNDKAYRAGRAYLKATATHCHLCKQAFTDRNDITADHVIAGDPASPLAPAHSLCNSRRGNKPLT